MEASGAPRATSRALAAAGVAAAGTLAAGIDLPAATPTLRGTGGFMGFSVPESPGQLVGYQITFEGGPGGRGEGLGQVEVSYVLRGGPLFRLRTREHREALWLLGVDLVGNATLALDGTSAFNASIGIGVSLMWLHVQPFHLNRAASDAHLAIASMRTPSS